MTNEEIKKILENHQHWLDEDVVGWREMKAVFACADLEGVNLEGVNLRGADFRCANLTRADLTDADLEEADLEGARLEGAYLSGACLIKANLSITDLEGANLEWANLDLAYLVNARLNNACLVAAYLRNVDFRGANLEGVNLKNAYLRGADLRSAENVPFIPMACPEEGGFIGWKKAMRTDSDLCIIKLHIPEDAKRSSATGRKCRCNKAKVLSIEDLKTAEPLNTAVSIYDRQFI